METFGRPGCRTSLGVGGVSSAVGVVAGEPERAGDGVCDWGFSGMAYTTICLRPRRGFRMNLRVRRVTCESAMVNGFAGRWTVSRVRTWRLRWKSAAHALARRTGGI